MYHSKTPDIVKEEVLNGFVEENSLTRIVIATSALRVGVKIR